VNSHTNNSSKAPSLSGGVSDDEMFNSKEANFEIKKRKGGKHSYEEY